jgi:DNA-binding MarR family transcriptional regulator
MIWQSAKDPCYAQCVAKDVRVAELMDSFRRIVQALRSSHRAAAYLNLTGAQLFVINALHEARAPMSVRELAERTRTDPSTVSVVVTRLVKRGLVQRTRAAEDSRRAELTLTRLGIALQKKAPRTTAQKQLLSALEALSSRDAAVFLRLLERIAGAMGASEEMPKMLFDTPATPLARKRR